MSGIIGKIGSKTGTVDELDSGLDLVKPHIIPDVLYPAVSNIMVDGSTALSAVTTGPNGSLEIISGRIICLSGSSKLNRFDARPDLSVPYISQSPFL